MLRNRNVGTRVGKTVNFVCPVKYIKKTRRRRVGRTDIIIIPA